MQLQPRFLRASAFLSHIRYFVFVIKCANHQVNLAISSAVTGRASKAAVQHTHAFIGQSLAYRAQALKKNTANQLVCGAITRFFKY